MNFFFSTKENGKILEIFFNTVNLINFANFGKNFCQIFDIAKPEKKRKRKTMLVNRIIRFEVSIKRVLCE